MFDKDNYIKIEINHNLKFDQNLLITSLIFSNTLISKCGFRMLNLS
jgi:hypothetical protein